MSWKEYLELYEMKKENEAAYRPINDQYRREAKKETRKIVDAAKAAKALGSPESKGKTRPRRFGRRGKRMAGSS